MSFVDFSSWPREQEQSFVVFEQQQAESKKKAIMFGAIAGVIAFVFVVGIYAGVAPDTRDLSNGMNMSNLSKKSSKTEKADAPAPTPAPAATPAPAPAPAPDPK